ncbi:Cyclin-Y-like protein 1, partial [Sciurus carolinensis]|nr:Cyclin-Y-like protein 1 [Sciurus carolinensis]
GNTLTCCLCPNASPKLGRSTGSAEPDYESELCEVAAGDAVAEAVAPAPAAVEPAELDFGACEGHHLQHISDLEKPF